MSGYIRNGIGYNSEDDANLAAEIPVAYLGRPLDAGFIAEAILDSEWLVAHDAEVRAAAIEAFAPCDGGCSYGSGPEERCSAHGRPVAQVWALLDEVRADQQEKDAQIAREYGNASSDDLAEGQYSDEFADGYAYGRNHVVEAIVADIKAAAAIRAGGDA